MDFGTFIEGLSQYYELYDKGLKKQANKYIEEFVQTISALDKSKKNKVLFQLAQELCDVKKYVLFKPEQRGNGRIPFALDMLLRDYLYAECLDNKMPQLRWFYELYHNDKTVGMYATDMLERAYSSADRDKRTIELLLVSWLDVLGWGAHHFPEGCILTKEAVSNAIENCKKIISENDVDEKLEKELQYFEVLYQCYYKYENEGKIRSFQEYCNEAGLIE